MAASQRRRGQDRSLPRGDRRRRRRILKSGPRGHVAAPVKRDLGVNFAVATLLVLGTILAVGYFLAVRA